MSERTGELPGEAKWPYRSSGAPGGPQNARPFPHSPAAVCQGFDNFRNHQLRRPHSCAASAVWSAVVTVVWVTFQGREGHFRLNPRLFAPACGDGRLLQWQGSENPTWGHADTHFLNLQMKSHEDGLGMSSRQLCRLRSPFLQLRPPGFFVPQISAEWLGSRLSPKTLTQGGGFCRVV